MNTSICSDSVCSDDTEYLLGQNVSLREIDDGEDQTDYQTKLEKGQEKEPPQKAYSPLQTKYNTRVTSARHTHRSQRDQNITPPQRHDQTGRFATKAAVAVAFVEDVNSHKAQDLHKESRGVVQSKDDHLDSREEQRGSETVDEFQSRKYKVRDHYTSYAGYGQGNIDIQVRTTSDISNGQMHKRGLEPNTHTHEYDEKVVTFSPPTKDPSASNRKNERTTIGVSKGAAGTSATEPYPWVADAAASLDISANQDGTGQLEQGDMASVLSDTTEDLVGMSGEEDLDEQVTEKLKKINLAVNYDTESEGYLDDKVKEGAELLSKLFGGSVDNYYSSSSGHSKSSVSGNAQDASGTGIHAGEVKTSLDGSGGREALKPALLSEQRQLTKHKRARVSFATDDSSSFDSTPAPSRPPRHERNAHAGAGPREEHVQGPAGTEGEFIRDTLAFRAAMDYDDDDSGGISAHYDSDRGRGAEQVHKATDRRGHRQEVYDDSGGMSAHYDSDRGRGAEQAHKATDRRGHRQEVYDDSGGMSAHYDSDRGRGAEQAHKATGRRGHQQVVDDVSASSSPGRGGAFSGPNRGRAASGQVARDGDWKPAAGQYFDERSTGPPSRNVNTQEPRFKVEKYQDSSRKELSAILIEGAHSNGGFMTSTPQVYRPPDQSAPPGAAEQKDKLLQLKLRETEAKLQKSIQELRDIEFDTEEAMANKKILMQEVRVLEEQLDRNRAESQSSENLVEQYRQQATRARGELMELEVKRETLQEDIKKVSELLSRQKQEAAEVTKSERENEMKVFELSLEKDQLQRDVESMRSRLQHAEEGLGREKQSYLESVGMLQDQLHQEQRTAKDTIDKLKEQVETERQKARDCHYERIGIIHKLQDETKDMHDKEMESLKQRMAREKDTELEALQKRMDRETGSFQRKLQEKDLQSQQLEIDLKEKEEEIRRLKSQLQQEQQKMHSSETSWQEDAAKRESLNASLRRDVETMKENEASAQAQLRNLEEVLDEKTSELRRSEDKHLAQCDELYHAVQSKENEISMLRGLVRQQEDSTRQLGETMRTEAQEHVRVALEKERENMDKERRRHQQRLQEAREQHERALTQLREDLQAEKHGHAHLQGALHKLKKEVERLREVNLQAEEQKVTELNQVRSDAKAELSKLKEKLLVVTSLTEKSERETVQELNDEVRRNAVIIGDSSCSTPVRNLSSSFHSTSPSSAAASPTHSALVNLRSCNEELRHHLVEARRELEQQRREAALKKQNFGGDELSTQQLTLVKKAMKSKEEEVARLKRQLHEENERNALQLRSERSAYQKTIDRLERELKQTKALTPTGSPAVNGYASPLDNTSLVRAGLSTSPSSTASPRPGDDSNTARLLRHLQGRVQLLRSQNESLRKSSDSDVLNESQSSVGALSVDSFEASDEASQIRRLRSALKVSEEKSQKHSTMLNQKMSEMTKLQKMLTHATKENMKLERAYASLQRQVIDGTR